MGKYKPVSFDKFEKEALKDPKVKTAYDELETEFALMAEFIKARKIAHKTQKEVADKMQSPTSRAKPKGTSA